MPYKDSQANKDCIKKWHAENRDKVNANHKKWKENNPEKVKQENRDYALKNPEKRRASALKYRNKDPAKARERLAAWRKDNKEKEKEYRNRPEVKERAREVRRKWREENKNWIVTSRLRKRLTAALKSANTKKSQSVIDLIGCSPADLVLYLESLFQDGMTWDNRMEWHIDHIRPCVSFDLSDPLQQKECFHFSNLQPLWAIDNFLKGSKWSSPTEPDNTGSVTPL